MKSVNYQMSIEESNMTVNPLVQGIPIKRPAHDELPIQGRPVEIVTSWPVGTFVENICIGSKGQIFVSVESLDEVQRIDAGRRETYVKAQASVTGLSMLEDDICVNVGKIGQIGWSLLRYDPAGKELAAISVPEALFLNGSTLFSRQSVLVADSILGRIFQIDFSTGTSNVWLEHDLFKKISSEPMLPGINGCRVSGRAVYFTNTDRSVVGKVDVNSDGSPGNVQVLAERLVGDDFAVAEDGSLLITNHVYNSLTRLYKSGEREVIAGPEQHMQGCTSAAFGRTPETLSSLFVTTTGGILAPYQGTVREAKLLKVEVGLKAALIGL